MKGSITGIRELDRLIRTSVCPGNLIVIASRPGKGKTDLMLNIAENVSAESVSAFFSVEMKITDIVSRIISRRSGVDEVVIKAKDRSSPEWARVYAAVGDMRRSGLFVDETFGISVSEIEHRVRFLNSDLCRGKHDGLTGKSVSSVFVDTLQLVAPFGATHGDAEKTSNVVNGLVGLAERLRVTVFASSMMNRNIEHRPGGRPVLSDLLNSSSIEERASAVLMIHSSGHYADVTPSGHSNVEIVVAKNSGGPSGGSVKANFSPVFHSFTGVDIERD